MTVPTLLLPAALVEAQWVGPDAIGAIAASPAWAALARRAVVVGIDRGDGPPPLDPAHERWLHARLGLPAHTALAAASAIADDRPGADWRVDPVHLHVGRDHLLLTDPRALALDPGEARALADAVAPLFADDGLALDADAGTRWYLTERDPTRRMRLRTRPLAGALGRNIDAWSPVGEDARRWRRLSNEVQMTWHAHPVNARRDEHGRPTVNSLWIDGRVPGRAEAAADGAPAGEDIAMDLDAAARWATRDDHAASRAAIDLARRDVLRVDLRLLDARLAGDPARWLDAWRSIAADTLAPLASLQPPWGPRARVVLAGDEGWRTLEVATRGAWHPARWWRRPDAAALLDPRLSEHTSAAQA